jgi:tripartite-type tricarboxylate transporter receptor subunit TctC
MLCCGAVAAQTYPTHPIRILVTTGGAPDLISRALGEKLAEALGQPVVVEARTGANGNIAGELVARAAPDGHTLLLCPDSLIVNNPHVYSKMPFDPLKDLVPVALVASSELLLVVNPDKPFKTLPEFVDYAKKANPPLAYGSNGTGGQHHLTMEMLKAQAGIELLHVPYKNAAAAATGALGGEVSILFSGGAAGALVRAGRLRALAVAGPKRLAAFPDVPTIGETYPGFVNSIWLGLCAPRGTPEPVLLKLRTEVNKLLATADMREKFNRAGGLEPLISTPAEFAALIRADYDKYGKLIRALNIRVE